MIPSFLLRRQLPVLLKDMPPRRLPRHNHAASRGTRSEYSYDDYENRGYARNSYYNDPARSTQSSDDSRRYWNSRMNEYSDRYDARGEGIWEEDSYYGGSSSRYAGYSSATRDAYRGNGEYPEWDYGNQQDYGTYSNSHYDYSEGQSSNYRGYSSNHRYAIRSPVRRGRNNGKQRRRYHSSESRYNESNTGRPEPNRTSSIAGQLFRHQQDSFIQVDTARVLRDRRSPRTSPPPAKMAPDEDYLRTSLEGSTKTGVEDDLDGSTVVRKLLVLDLNGTLVYRSPHRSVRERLFGRHSAIGDRADDDVYAQFDPSQPRPLRAVHPRPYLSSFRQYLFHPKTRRWLDTMVWSSAQPHSVNDMVARSFGNKKDGLVAIWARDKLGLDIADYGRKVQTTKDLNKPWNELNTTSFNPSDIDGSSSSSSSGPQKRTHSARTTLLLDDSPLKAHLQPYNHLCLKEYDLEMRKHDLAIRELEVARVRLADAISGKKNDPEVAPETESKDKDLKLEGAADKLGSDGAAAHGVEDTQALVLPDSQKPEEETNLGKRKRKEKKENKKRERDEALLKKLTDEYNNIGGEYDETLLAVVGILDAVKTESNVAAWIRAGGIIQSLSSGNGEEVDSESSNPLPISTEAETPKKKIKLSHTVSSPSGHEDLQSEDSLTLASSPHVSQEESGPSSETERTGVPLDTDTPAADKGKEADEKRLWFDHPGAVPYWASRGRLVLDGLGIQIAADVVGPTG